jgi:hypothetical protein
LATCQRPRAADLDRLSSVVKAYADGVDDFVAAVSP